MSKQRKPRVLISVSNKTGVVDFAQGLAALGWQIVSTGGTAIALRKEGVPVTNVEQVTGMPECLNGRLKTLHPGVLAGILAEDTEEHRATMIQCGWQYFDMVVVNLYPFQATVAGGAQHDEAIAKIDVGGPTMARAAAKNYERVIVVVDPDDYSAIIQGLVSGVNAEPGDKLGISYRYRLSLMTKAFQMTAEYDAAIARHFARLMNPLARGTTRMPKRI